MNQYKLVKATSGCYVIQVLDGGKWFIYAPLTTEDFDEAAKELEAVQGPVPMLDAAGREVLPGRHIVYSRNLGRCATLAFAQVLKITYKVDSDNHGHSYIVKAKARVRGVYKGWNGKAEVLNPSTLSFGDRMLVVDELPSWAKEALG